MSETEADAKLPPGWTTRKIAEVGLVTYADKADVLSVMGWEHERPCGCKALIGMRLDLREMTFGGHYCDEHEAAVRRALETMRTMPPQERAAAEIFAEQLERELEPRVVKE